MSSYDDENEFLPPPPPPPTDRLSVESNPGDRLAVIQGCVIRLNQATEAKDEFRLRAAITAAIANGLDDNPQLIAAQQMLKTLESGGTTKRGGTNVSNMAAALRGHHPQTPSSGGLSASGPPKKPPPPPPSGSSASPAFSYMPSTPQHESTGHRSNPSHQDMAQLTLSPSSASRPPPKQPPPISRGSVDSQDHLSPTQFNGNSVGSNVGRVSSAQRFGVQTPFAGGANMLMGSALFAQKQKQSGATIFTPPVDEENNNDADDSDGEAETAPPDAVPPPRATAGSRQSPASSSPTSSSSSSSSGFRPPGAVAIPGFSRAVAANATANGNSQSGHASPTDRSPKNNTNNNTQYAQSVPPSPMTKGRAMNQSSSPTTQRHDPQSSPVSPRGFASTSSNSSRDSLASNSSSSSSYSSYSQQSQPSTRNRDQSPSMANYQSSPLASLAMSGSTSPIDLSTPAPVRTHQQHIPSNNKALMLLGLKEDDDVMKEKQIAEMLNEERGQSASMAERFGRVITEGLLRKKSPKGLLKVWQERWFRLFPKAMEYYKSKTDREPQGHIPLHAVKFVHKLTTSRHGGCRFDIVIGDSSIGRTFALQTRNAQECDQWVHNIKIALKMSADETSNANKNILAEGGKFWKDKGKIATMQINMQMAAAQSRQTVIASPPGKVSLLNDMNGNGNRNSIEQKEVATPTKARSMSIQVMSAVTTGPIGTIYFALDRHDSELFHLMHVVERSAPEYQQSESLFRAMSQLDHPFIFKQTHYGETTDTIWTVYTPPVRPIDSLLSHLNAHRRFPEHVVKWFGAQLVLALGYLHSNHIIFRNLSPENIYIDGDGNACICDFLLCLPPDEIPPECHIPEYNSPEHALNIESRVSDWWRLGVLLYEISVGIPPFRTKSEDRETEIAAMIATFEPENLRFPPFISASLQSLIRALLHPNPKKRLGGAFADWKDVRADPFFADTEWDQLSSGDADMLTPAWIVDNILKKPLAPAAPSTPEALQLAKPPKNLCRPKAGKIRYAVSVELFGTRGLALSSYGQEELSSKDKKKAAAAALDPSKAQAVTVGIQCTVECEHDIRKTSLIYGSTLSQPQFNSKFTFDLPYQGSDVQPNSDVMIELIVENKTAKGVRELSIGSIQLPLRDIKSHHPDPQDLWQSVIDANGLPLCELHVKYCWIQQRENSKQNTTGSQEVRTNTQPFWTVFGDKAHPDHGRSRSKHQSFGNFDMLAAQEVQGVDKYKQLGVPDTRKRNSIFGQPVMNRSGSTGSDGSGGSSPIVGSVASHDGGYYRQNSNQSDLNALAEDEEVAEEEDEDNPDLDEMNEQLARYAQQAMRR